MLKLNWLRQTDNNPDKAKAPVRKVSSQIKPEDNNREKVNSLGKVKEDKLAVPNQENSSPKEDNHPDQGEVKASSLVRDSNPVDSQDQGDAKGAANK